MSDLKSVFWQFSVIAAVLACFSLLSSPSSAQIDKGPIAEPVPIHSGNVAVANLNLRKVGSGFVLEFSGVTRRNVIDRLFAASGASVSWSDGAGADEPVRGRVTGTVDQIMTTLLPRFNYVIVRRPIAGELRVASVIILGPSSRPPEERPPQVVASVRTERKGSPIEQYFQAQQAQAAQFAPPVAVRK